LKDTDEHAENNIDIPFDQPVAGALIRSDVIMPSPEPSMSRSTGC
jgi:hypothetical protein